LPRQPARVRAAARQGLAGPRHRARNRREPGHERPDTFNRRDWNTILDEDGTKEFVVEELLGRGCGHPGGPGVRSSAWRPLPPHGGRALVAGAVHVGAVTRGRHARENLAQFMVENQRHMLALTAQHYTDEDWMRAIGEVPQ
jgi:hypothetical protein